MTRHLLLLTEPDHAIRWDAAGDALHDRGLAAFREFLLAVHESGSVLVGEALVDPAAARAVEPGATPSERVVTEGPFVETVEEIGGFSLLDLPDMAAALDVAALLPRSHTVEVRGCLDIDATGSG